MVDTYKIIKSIVHASQPKRLTFEITNEEYRAFVFSCLAEVSDPLAYSQLGLAAEIGEVSQVLCKHLRLNRDASQDLDKLLDELGDCIYWVTVNPGTNMFDDVGQLIRDVEDLLTEVWIDPSSDIELVPGGGLIEYLQQVNFDKLTKRKANLGSFIKE